MVDGSAGELAPGTDSAICHTVPAVCFSAIDHDHLLELWQDDIDALMEAEGRIRGLQMDVRVFQQSLQLASLHAKKAETETAILEAKRGGFWRRHFRLCGGIGGAVELIGDDAGDGSLAVFGGLCVLP